MSQRRSSLDGVRVVELGAGLALPFAARLLADAGADVVKVETPTGDRTRGVAPMYAADGGDQRSALFEYLNLNKRGVVLDPIRDSGLLAGLLGPAHILMIGDDRDLWDCWGLDSDTLRSEFPHLVIVSLTPFGYAGPKSHWMASDLILQAASGLMSFSGSSDMPPLKRGLRQSTYETGITAAYTALSGLFAVRRGAGGVFVDISMAECITSEIVLQIPEYTYVGAVATRRPPVLNPFQGDPVKVDDGFVTVQVSTILPVSAFAKFLDAPALADERFETAEGRATYADDLSAALREALSGTEPRDFFERSAAVGLLTGFSQTAAQLLECPQLTARDVFIRMPGRLAGREWRMPFRTAVFSGTPTSYRSGAPGLGEHNTELLTIEKELAL